MGFTIDYLKFCAIVSLKLINNVSLLIIKNDVGFYSTATVDELLSLLGDLKGELTHSQKVDLYNEIKNTKLKDLQNVLKEYYPRGKFEYAPEFFRPTLLGLNEEVTLKQYYESLLKSAEAGLTKEEIEGKVSI